MKKYIYILLIIVTTISCTEEIVLDDIQNSTPRLVVEADIDWDKNDDEASKTQTIKLTKSVSYYNQEYPIVSNANITITNSNNTSMGTFVYDSTQELYIATDFLKPIVGETYFLKIEVDGQVYTATDTYTSIVNPNYITQSLNYDLDPSKGLFQIDLNIDNEIGVDNYYLFKTQLPLNISLLPDYSTADDSLLSEEPGKNNYDFTYIDEDFKVGDILKITTFGISKRYNDYLIKIILNTEGGSSGPFSTAPSTIRGNVLNETDEENRAFGFFSMNEFAHIEYTIQEQSEDELITEF